MSANPIVIRPSAIKCTVRFVITGLLFTPMFIVSFTLMAAGWFHLSWPSSLLLGVILATPLVWTFMLVSLLLAITRDVPRVEIGPDGFVLCLLGTRRSRRWADVEGGFVVRGTALGRDVAYRVTEAFKKKSEEYAAQSGRLPTYEWVGNCFETSTVALAELFNGHKRRAAGSS